MCKNLGKLTYDWIKTGARHLCGKNPRCEASTGGPIVASLQGYLRDSSLHDLAISNTIDCDIFSIHTLSGREARTHRTVLESAEIVPHCDFFRFRKYVEDYFLRVRKNLKFASKKSYKICAAPTGGSRAAILWRTKS
jgi:hypothetical protein